MMRNWNVAFITGGSSGIGRQMAGLLLDAGTSVAVFDRSNNPETVQQMQEMASSRAGVSCEFFLADVTDEPALMAAVDRAIETFGKPDFALNCAGIQNARPFLDLTAQEFAQVVMVNLVGSRNFAAAVLPHMSHGSQLALVASLAGLVTSYSYSAYNASKHGVVGLAGALRLECIAQGIEVSVICPPEINTPMVVEERKTLPEAGARLKNTAGTLEVGPACEYMLKQLQRRRYMIVPGFRARVIARVARWFPNSMRLFSEQVVIRTLRTD